MAAHNAVIPKSQKTEKSKYDVFLVFKSQTDDEDKVRQMASELEKRGIRCVYDDRSNRVFRAGQPVFKSIVECIEQSKTILLLLSQHSVDSSWVLLETILAIEKSKRCNILCLKIVLEGVNGEKVEFLKRDLLASVPHFKLDFNKDEWADKLRVYVEEDVKIHDILPVGSLAHGLVFSHFVGFCRYAYPELQKQLPKHDIYKKNPGRVSTRYYLLLPKSCNILDDLESVDKTNGISIKKESVLPFYYLHAGKPRSFSISVYSIQKEGERPFYFFADNPNVLKAIHKMKADGLAKVDVPFQVARFYHTMNEVINHGLNQTYNNAVELLPYNDEHESMQKLLLEAVKRQLHRPIDIVYERMPNRLTCKAHQNENQRKDVTILCVPHIQEDREIVYKIAAFLESNGITVATECGDDRGNMSETKITPANWYIFVISEQTLDYKTQVAVKCMACLHDSICDNSLCVLPVVRKVQPRDIPPLIRWVTLVSTEEPNYLQVLLQTMRGKPVTMQHKIPCGDVATGLAWAYYINYLSIIMQPGIRDRIEELLKSKCIRCGCIEKLFIIVPSSCRAEEKIHKKANESLAVPVIEYIGATNPLERTLAGQQRKFYLHMYRYIDPESKKSICFLSEYSAAVNCLYEMTKLEFAGLTPVDMKIQCAEFVSIMEDIMKRKAVKEKLGDIVNLVKFIYYDDAEQTLLEALQNEITNSRQQPLVCVDGRTNEVERQ